MMVWIALITRDIWLHGSFKYCRDDVNTHFPSLLKWCLIRTFPLPGYLNLEFLFGYFANEKESAQTDGGKSALKPAAAVKPHQGAQEQRAHCNSSNGEDTMRTQMPVWCSLKLFSKENIVTRECVVIFSSCLGQLFCMYENWVWFPRIVFYFVFFVNFFSQALFA